jgi:hypothetical protein
MTSTLAVLQVASASAWCLLLWKVQLVSYPLFAHLPTTSWTAFHREHCRRIAWIVVPLFLVDGSLAFWNGVLAFSSDPLLQSLSMGTYIASGALTGFLFAPLHRRYMSLIPSQAELRNLARLNWIRTVLASVRMGVVIAGSL